jgi:hypothetical protein
MSFLYFIPSGQNFGQGLLKEVGMDYLTADKMRQVSMLNSGPEDQAGILCADNRLSAKDLFYRPAEQKWEKSINGKFWIGYWLDNPPTESNLRRPVLVNHYKVTLNNGQAWAVPVVRLYSGKTVLDETVTLDGAGNIKYKTQKRYEALCERVNSLWGDIAIETGQSPGPFKLDDKARYELATEVMQLNYNIGPQEISMMELFTKNNLSEIFRAVLDIPYLEKALELLDQEVKKKLEPITPG